MMRALWLILAVIAPVSAFSAEAPARQPVREGPVERLVLDGGLPADAAAWSPAESTVTPDRKHTRRGESALLFHVAVNWETGEPKYPIGWPRMSRPWPQAVQDWSAYDYLELSIYVESSRPSLPVTPMGMSLRGKDGRDRYNRSLTELKRNQWTDYRIPIHDLPTPTCTGMQVHISESEYKHLDKLDFWIDTISLVRYVQPTVAASRLAEQALLADSQYLTVQLAVMGIRPGEKAAVGWAIASKGRTAAKGTVSVPRGRNTVHLPLPSGGLRPGDYEVTLQCSGENPPPFPLRVTSSPFAED